MLYVIYNVILQPIFQKHNNNINAYIMNPRFPDISSPYPRRTLSRHHVRQSGLGVRSVNVTLYMPVQTESEIQSRNVSSDNSTSVNSPFL